MRDTGQPGNAQAQGQFATTERKHQEGAGASSGSAADHHNQLESDGETF
jgi:hypothetical protein